MFLGAFGEYCVRPGPAGDRRAQGIPFDRACLIGCGVMTGVGGALNVADIEDGGVVMVIGAARWAWRRFRVRCSPARAQIIAVDLDDGEARAPAKSGRHGTPSMPARRSVAIASRDAGRGADTCSKRPAVRHGFRLSVEAVRPAAR